MLTHRTLCFCYPVSYASDSAGCDCGFMSVERMRIVLGLETFGDRTLFTTRQQITPDINFTCDGLITKWIIGAGWLDNGNSYSELQVWRKVGNNVYHKMNGTFIAITMQISTRIYEYDTFSPIPVLAGDILGVFQPDNDISQLGLWSERDNGPLTYYLPTDDTATESPFSFIDVQNMLSLSSQTYHPLVTVEMSKLLVVFPKWFIYMHVYIAHSCEQPYKLCLITNYN